MVKLQKRTTKKHYLNNKRIYTYNRVSFDVPSRFHAAIAAFFNQDLNVDLTVKDTKMFIVLERKT